jgi:hypothetical protein
MKYILILIFVVLVGLVVSSLIKRKERKLPFGKKKYFFSEAEKKFYLVLKQIADKNNWVIFPKVRLRDIFYVLGRNYSKERFIYNSKIVQKHVDFLLCDTSNFSPIAGIELDDSSHFLEKRKQRDEFVDKVFLSTNLPLLRIRVSSNYDINSLEQNILQNINKT